MSERIAAILILTIYGYLASGLLVAIVIVPFGLSRIDSEAKGASFGFRAIMFPGAVALWPLMLKRCIRGTGEAPLQKDPHR